MADRSSASIREDLCKVLFEMGFAEESERLRLQGPEGYPDELAFMAASRLLSGRLEVLTLEGKLLSYGEWALPTACCTDNDL